MAATGSGFRLPFGMTPDEVEFCALEMPVTIHPNFAMEKLQGVTTSPGPFVPGVPITVPLWMAIQLRKRKKCTIQPPDWMTVDRLRHHVEAEQTEAERFVELPFHYIEIAKVLCQHAPSDIRNIEEVRSLVQEIQELREKKTVAGLKMLKTDTTSITLTNMSWMEINVVRDFLCSALDQFEIIRKARKELPPRPSRPEDFSQSSGSAFTQGASSSFLGGRGSAGGGLGRSGSYSQSSSSQPKR